MMDNKNLFSAFSPVDRDEWWTKVAKDLKGRNPAELRWKVESELDMDPFYHFDSQEITAIPQGQIKNSNHWEIAECFQVNFTQIIATNQTILSALMGGAEAIQLTMDRRPTEPELEQLLQGLKLSYISTHLVFNIEEEIPLAWLGRLITIVKVHQDAHEPLRGSLHFPRLRPAKRQEFQQVLAKALPGFKCQNIQVDYREGITRGLAKAIHEASHGLDLYAAGGMPPEQINRYLHFSIQIGCQYFVEMARIRALRLLWANVLQAYGLKSQEDVCIEAHLHPDSQLEDQHANMIRATTQAMSAVLGGADRLTVLPANTPLEGPNEFTRRIARNVQHLLKMETYLDRVVDPAAGSYYIETLTQKIATAAWKQFREMG
ncbi:MAG: methylmalonyl-CoA mutase family protein [Bacteroidota bacterium]